jgi:hypothetical protein
VAATFSKPACFAQARTARISSAAVIDPDRRSSLSLASLPEDIELELEACYGLGGLIRARSVAITFEPGRPNEQDMSQE